MKVYRNIKEGGVVGIKYDDMGNTQLLLTATGSLDKEVVITREFRDRDSQGDFNADPDFQKDYNADMTWVVGYLIGACEYEKDEFRFEIHHISDGKIAISVSEKGIGYDELVSRVAHSI